MIRRSSGIAAPSHSARIYKTGTQTRAMSTTLAAASAAAATTISTVASIPSGTAITIEGETRTTSAVSGAGPYTVTVPALTNAHASGVAVTWTDNTLASFADTPITMGAVDFSRGDTLDLTTVNAIRATKAGLYLANVEAWFSGGPTGDRNVSLKVNGTSAREFGIQTAGRLSGTSVLPVTAGALITINVYVAVNSVQILGSASKDTGLTLTYLGS